MSTLSSGCEGMQLQKHNHSVWLEKYFVAFLAVGRHWSQRINTKNIESGYG
jgi:hypothetical protein